MTFQVGDRGEHIREGQAPSGLKGTVVDVATYALVGVSWDNWHGGHTCEGKVKDNSGFYEFPSDLKREGFPKVTIEGEEFVVSSLFQEASLSPSEAVYGFASWLTTRKEPLTISSRHDAAVVAELVNMFCEGNDLTEPREYWTDDLVVDWTEKL